MNHYFSPSTGVVYHPRIHASIPADAFEITDAEFLDITSGRSAGRRIELSETGRPVVVDPPPPAVSELCDLVDRAADAARHTVAGDPLRAEEYKAAAAEAKTFAEANYQGAVPPMVAAWAINGRTAQQAADNILAEAAQYTAALVQLRTVRLAAKEQIRTLMAADQVEQAQQLAEQTIAAIAAAVAGIGNNG